MTHGVVIYDSNYGNNAKLAQAVSKGLINSDIDVEVFKVGEFDIERLHMYDLLCVGGPTQIMRMSNQMREFFSQIKSVNLRGKNGFCFGTRINSRMNRFDLNGSAKKIEGKLRKKGVGMLLPAVNILVEGREGPLSEGSEQLLQDIGSKLGAMIR